MRIPPVLLKHLLIEDETKTVMVVQDEKGKHGKYFSAWKKRDPLTQRINKEIETEIANEVGQELKEVYKDE